MVDFVIDLVRTRILEFWDASGDFYNWENIFDIYGMVDDDGPNECEPATEDSMEMHMRHTSGSKLVGINNAGIFILKGSTSNVLTCAKCSNLLKRSRILQCLHSFCAECLDELSRRDSSSNSIHCPVCKEKTSYGFEGWRSLKQNFYLDNLVDMIRERSVERKLCSYCAHNQRETVTVKKCLKCSLCVCARCAEAHNIDHKIVDFKDLQSGKHDEEIRQVQKMYCQFHVREKIRKFCQDCDIPVCSDCIDSDHRLHNYANPSIMIENNVPELKHFISVIEENVEALKSAIDDEKNISEEIKQKEEKFTKGIIDSAEIITSIVTKKKLQATEKVQEFFNTPFKSCISRIKELEELKSIGTNGLNFCKSILEHGKDIEILSLESALRNRLTLLERRITTYLDKSTVNHQADPVITFNDVVSEAVELLTSGIDIHRSSECCTTTTDKTTQTDIEKPKTSQTETFEKRHKRAFTVESQHDKNIPQIVAIARYDEESIVVADKANNVLKVFAADGSLKMVHNLSKLVPQNITVCGDTIVVSKSSEILFMSKNGKHMNRELVMCDKESVPLASCYTSDNQFIVVGNFNQNVFFPLTVFDSKGKMVKNIPLNHALPIHLAGSNDGHIIMSDWKNCGAIRIIDIIKGNQIAILDASKLESENELRTPRWRPGCLAVDDKGNILIADRRAIVILDKEGKFLKEIDRFFVGMPKCLTYGSNMLYFTDNQNDVLYIYRTPNFLKQS